MPDRTALRGDTSNLHAMIDLYRQWNRFNMQLLIYIDNGTDFILFHLN